jgi:hypothetical protein
VAVYAFEELARIEPSVRVAGRWLPAGFALGFILAFLSWWPDVHPVPVGDMSSPRAHGSPGLSDTAEIASFLATNDPPGKMWNEFWAGGALIWKLNPPRRVFMDGRTAELHAFAGTFSDWVSVSHVLEGWEDVLKRHDCDLAFLNRDPFVDIEFKARGWVPVRELKTFVLYVRRGSPSARALGVE